MATPLPGAGDGSLNLFYSRWRAAQPGFDGRASACPINSDGAVHKLISLPTSGLVSSVAFRNVTGNSGTLIVYADQSGPPLMTLAAGQDRSIYWVDPGLLYYKVTGSASSDVYEASFGA